MSNKLARPMVAVPDYLVGTIIVPDGVTLYPGDIVLANTYSTAISKNYSVFDATKPLTATLGEQMAIVINDGFEQLSDGRRPAGQPDYTKYEFIAGDVVTIIFLAPKLRFEVSYDAVTDTPVVGKFMYPTNDAYLLTVGVSIPAGTFSAMKVLALKDFRLGGQFGGEFASTAVAIVENPTPA